MANIAFFNDVCGFPSVAVNSVYKLKYFFTFIFAALLPVLSRLLIMSINTTFFDFSFFTFITYIVELHVP